MWVRVPPGTFALAFRLQKAIRQQTRFLPDRESAFRRASYTVPVAQWIAHQTSDLGVGGSSPPWDYLCQYFDELTLTGINCVGGDEGEVERELSRRNVSRDESRSPMNHDLQPTRTHVWLSILMSTSNAVAKLMWSYDAQAAARLIAVCKTRLQKRPEEICFPTAFCKQTEPARPVAYTQQMVCRSMMLDCIRNESVLGLEPRISCSVGRRLIHWAIRACWFDMEVRVFMNDVVLVVQQQQKRTQPDAGLEPATSRLRACHSTD